MPQDSASFRVKRYLESWVASQTEQISDTPASFLENV